MYRSLMWVLVVALLPTTGCEAKPYAPPNVESFVHSAEAPPLGAPADLYPQAQVRISSVDEIDHVLAVRLAISERQRSRGLRGVRDLPTGTGLLFVFPEEEHVGGITTDGVRTVLDVAFIDKDGQILSVFTGNPCREKPCTVYDPEQPYQAVLELPVGWLQQHALGSGDVVSWSITSEETG